MDRQLNHKSKISARLFKPFEYHDIIPYTIAILMLAGEIYIAAHFKQLLFQ
ncbi:MAG: hypothetical protein JWN76_1326 [Chitinophagaceae bacterium]|nr:hypothetical protein [Chitinophagaceae bacterium]